VKALGFVLLALGIAVEATFWVFIIRLQRRPLQGGQDLRERQRQIVRAIIMAIPGALAILAGLILLSR